MSTNRRSSSRLRANSPPAAAANDNPNALQTLPEDATTRETNDNPREETLQDLQGTESDTIATGGPVAGQTADSAGNGLEAELRELEALRRRLAIAGEKAKLLAELREKEREAAILEAQEPGAAPPLDPLDDAASVAAYHRPNTTRPMPAASVASQGSAPTPPAFRNEAKEPRTPSNMIVYKAESSGEYDLFKSKQEAFWNRYPDWFCNDTRKVDRVTEFLAPKVNLTWMEYRKNNPNKEFTWRVFETWALAQVTDPVEMQREAKHEWWWAVQAKHQDVHQYALRLTGIYNRLRDTPSRQQRIDRLQTGILKEVQAESRRFAAPTTDQ